MNLLKQVATDRHGSLS